MELARFLLVASLLLTACASRPPSSVTDVSSGPSVDLRSIAARAPFTVVTFFSAHCPCQTAHDARLRDLYAAYAPRGVQFVAIDAESGASDARAAAEHDKRRYPYPVLADPGGASADALAAAYATYTVVLDREGRVRYHGGIDSDRTHLTRDAEPYVKNALDDLLEGRDVRTKEGKVLGCALSR